MPCSRYFTCCRCFCDCTSCKGSAKNLRSALFIAGFIGCIRWSFGVYWPLSVCLSVLLCLVLVIWIRRFHKSLHSLAEEERLASKENSVGTIEPRDAEVQPQQDDLSSDDGLPSIEAAPPSGSKAIPLTLSILYIVLVFSISTPGAILSLKAIPCYEYYYNTGNKVKHGPTLPRGQSFWTTENFQDLPSGVRSWIDAIYYAYGAETSYPVENAGHNRFCKVGDTTYFEGKVPHETSNSLMSTSGIAPASKVGLFDEPTWITQVTNTTCCFFSHDFSRVVCGNNNKGFDRYVSLADGAYPAFFTEIDGLLWFVQTCEKDEYSQNLHAYQYQCLHEVCSLDVTTMDLAVYSDARPNVTIEEDSDDDDTKSHLVKRNCYPGVSTAGQMIGGLFMSAVPMVMTSIGLWKRGIPSSSFTLYVGLGLVCQFTTAAFEQPYDEPTGFGAWLVIGTPMWILVTAFVIAVNKTAQRSSVLYFGLYSISSFAVLFVFANLVVSVEDGYSNVDSEEVEVWFMLTVLAFVPLILVGILVKSSYIFILGVLGIAAIVSAAIFRLSHLGIAVSLLIWAAAILVVILIGFAIHRKREIVHCKIASGIARCAGHKHEKADAGECTGLLPNGEARSLD